MGLTYLNELIFYLFIMINGTFNKLQTTVNLKCNPNQSISFRCLIIKLLFLYYYHSNLIY